MSKFSVIQTFETSCELNYCSLHNLQMLRRAPMRLGAERSVTQPTLQIGYYAIT